jgi:hypothetical protein
VGVERHDGSHTPSVASLPAHMCEQACSDGGS